MSKKKAKKILEEIVLAPPGTNITQNVRIFQEALSSEEKKLQQNFQQRKETLISLSKEDIEKISNELSNYWMNYLRREEERETKYEELSMVPALMACGHKELAEQIVSKFTGSERFDKERHCLYHTRYYYHKLGDKFIGLEDNLRLVYALHYIGKEEDANRVMKSVRENLVDISYQFKGVGFGIKEMADEHEKKLKKEGFEVEKKEFFRVDGSYGSTDVIGTHPKKVSDLDVLPYTPITKVDLEGGVPWGWGQEASRVSNYLLAETLVGDRELATKIVRSLGAEYCSAHYKPMHTDVAARYLMAIKLLNEVESLPVAKSSEELLKSTFIPEWNLYKSFETNSIGMNELKTYDQLSVMLLYLHKGQINEARALLTSTVNAGLYKKGRFIDKENLEEYVNFRTNALGMIVMEYLRNPDKIKQIVFNIV